MIESINLLIMFMVLSSGGSAPELAKVNSRRLEIRAAAGVPGGHDSPSNAGKQSITSFIMETINVPPWGHPLEEKDYRNLEARWITRELANQALLRRVSSEEGAAVVGHRGGRDCAGILIPYYLPGSPDVINYRLRRDAPELRFNEMGEAKPEGKYLGPPNGGNRLYVVPGTPVEYLTDLSLPVVLTEGEFKTMALFRLASYNSTSFRFLPIGLAGVWNWRGVVGKTDGPNGERLDVKGPIPDLGRLSWAGRIVRIIFDTNVRSNQMVAAARRELSKELKKRGAQVFWTGLPVAVSRG
ncbi:MAG: DUF3854 domain-containing protein [Acidobacteriia bacterium]|nr:DUF3854 domain-containing protein [Terriglobia bacterium]